MDRVFVPFDPPNRGEPGGDNESDDAPDPLAKLGELANHHTMLRCNEKLDYVGFENVQRPLFLDPLLTDRLQTDFPAIAELRRATRQDGRPGSIRISDTVADEHRAMRAALTVADELRLRRWLENLDVVVPAFEGKAEMGFYAACFGTSWPEIASAIKHIGVFASIPEAIMLHPCWPRYNTYVMKASMFLEFAEALFTALEQLAQSGVDHADRNLRFIAERLLGAYLRFAHLRSPLIRFAYVPVLLMIPEEPPRSLPADFDPEAYLACNPDVAGAGMEAATHYLRFGWQELREWHP